ncbi:MAG: ribonuclease H-like domain-containing protein [Smithellaceae bacterium]
MSSIDKLKRLTGEKIKAPAKQLDKNVKLDELRRRIEAVVSRTQTVNKATRENAVARGNKGLAEIISGEEIENDYGKFFLISEIVRGSCRHGHRNISEASGFDMTAAAMLANNPAISEFSCSDALFLDTETTGLTGGTGTMAFLIGLGWFEEGHFHFRQILARDFSEEKAALLHLAAIAGKKKFLVTFNGKAFDINLLTTRFIMNRLEGGLSLLPHLDLLHPSRRILGHRLENSRLVTLESEVLGVQREGDIPGWEIPQRYFDWLKRRDPRLLAGIFEHNRLDVISMASLTAHLIDIMTAQAIAQYAHTDDYLAAARLLLNRRNPEGTGKILNMLQVQSCQYFSARSKKKLAQLYKRTGRLNEAVQIWQEMAACEPPGFYAVSELAKWLEHRAFDSNQAKMLVEKALHQDNLFSEEEKESLLHRLKRLNAKIKSET